ncbi:hypothetical protein PV325_000429 [Microctonus aethiopoides]|nr:hypothetical protein PV325_000429 [Microctonus aethiopoides]KAK0094020.1 hypothetical protein PV326_012053 [Microctonus aethiopoides]
MAINGFTTPELFMYLDHQGFIQDELNTPIFYHIKRHSNNKKISLDHDDYSREKLMFSTTLSVKDVNDRSRLNKSYEWLKQDAEFLDELRRRARIKTRSRN